MTDALRCGECGAPMKLVKSKTQTQRDGITPRYFFGCTAYPVCRGTLGADAWGKPIGIPCDRETKDARHKAHGVFDAYWKSLKWSRSAAYRWLARMLRIDKAKCGFAMFDLQQCNQVVDIIQKAQQRREAKA